MCLCKRVTRKNQKVARLRAYRLITDVRKKLKEKGYVFQHNLVGSSSWNTAIEDWNGKYDLDYQLILTNRSVCIKEKKYQLIKSDFVKAFKSCINEDESIRDSTSTAITLLNDSKTGKKFSIDFVIMHQFSDGMKILRKTNSSYVWNKLPNYPESYRKFELLSAAEKQKIIDDVVSRKCQKLHNKAYADKSSSEILLEVINEHVR